MTAPIDFAARSAALREKRAAEGLEAARVALESWLNGRPPPGKVRSLITIRLEPRDGPPVTGVVLCEAAPDDLDAVRSASEAAAEDLARRTLRG